VVIRKERGFTLIELMIVLAIIGVLLTIVLPRVGNILDRADERATLKNLQNLQLAIEAFADMNNGKYPTVLGSDANNNGIGDIGEIMMEYFGDRWPVAKLRRGVKATRVNAGISFGPVIDVDKDGFITTTDIIYSIKNRRLRLWRMVLYHLSTSKYKTMCCRYCGNKLY
jgi:prepilin-type N-terminal cleavage/methylation domain-containing protein